MINLNFITTFVLNFSKPWQNMLRCPEKCPREKSQKKKMPPRKLLPPETSPTEIFPPGKSPPQKRPQENCPPDNCPAKKIFTRVLLLSTLSYGFSF